MTQIVMPQLGESVTEGTIARWLKQPGEHVERYEAIAEVVTDKVNAEIPAPSDGVMGRHLVEEGALVPVGAPICELDSGDSATADAEVEQPAAVGGGATVAAEGSPGTFEAAPAQPGSPTPPAAASQPPAEELPAAPAPEPPEPAAAPQPPAKPTIPPPQPAMPPAAGAAEVGPAGGESNGVHLHVTPAVRMLAREHGIDLSQVPGSGLGGRITKRDVLTFVQQQGARPAPVQQSPRPAPAPAPAAPAPPARSQATPAASPPATAAPQPSADQLAGDTLVPLTQARRAIAEHMVRSKATAPHAWTMVEVDMTRVVRVRNREKRAFAQATGANLTFLPFVARATIASLRRYPMLNATFTPDGILVRHEIHLGIAVALEDSLMVPVIRNADRLSLAGLAQAARDLGERARAGKLRIEEITAGTFTLNNTGALGLVLTMPIINQPQAAILAMDAIVKRPIVTDDDAIAIRSMMHLSFSFDHRLVDGLAAARFIGDVKQQLESIDESASVL